MGKDDTQLFKEKQAREDKFLSDPHTLEHQQRETASYLIKDETYKQLLYRVPEAPKPKFLSKTSLL